MFLRINDIAGKGLLKNGSVQGKIDSFELLFLLVTSHFPRPPDPLPEQSMGKRHSYASQI